MKLKKRSDFDTDEAYAKHLEEYRTWLESQNSDDSLEGIKNKNKELLEKLAKKKEELEKIEKERADEIRKAEEEKLKAEGKFEELIESIRTNSENKIKELEKQITEKDAIITKSKADLNELLVVQGLNTDLLALGVNDPDLLEAAIAIIGPKAKIVETEDGKLSVEIDGKKKEDFFKTWGETKGKAFISNGSSGGGANNDRQGNTDDYEQYYNPESGKLNLTKQLELERKDPERHKELKKKYENSKTLPLSNRPTF